MTALNDFPYETLVNIFSTLSCSDLASVALVSQRWHMISEPLLYRDYRPGNVDGPNTHCTTSTDTSQPRRREACR